MPRPTRPELLNNPIRQLRRILAPPLGKKYLSQRELSAIVDIPLDSLRSVESNRLDFSPLMRNRIKCETGGVFDDRDECWRFWKPDGPKYCREHYLKYRELIGKDVEKALPLDVFLAALRIKLLMETLRPEKQFKFLFRLNTFLESNRKEFCPAQFAELFADASSYIEAHPELDREHPLVVFRRYPPRLAAVLAAIAPGAIDWFATKLDPADYEITKQSRPAPHAKQRRKKTAAVSSAGE
jgi:hypothetical protein